MARFQRFCVSCVLLLSFLFFQLIGSPVSFSADENPCDPDLEQSVDDELGYHQRENRCEGRYIQEVGSTILFLVSFTATFEEYDLHSDEGLNIQWLAPEERELHLRAQGLRQRLYYRMDVIRPTSSRSYHWPINVLQALEIPRSDLGLIGWIASYPIGESKHDLYLPLRIKQQEDKTQSQSYQVTLWPGKELEEVYVSLAPVNADGTPGNFIQDEEALEYGYYPAEQPIEFEISELGAPGVYYLEIGAILRNGGGVTLEHRFYHAQ